jgi:hypothetical protein
MKRIQFLEKFPVVTAIMEVGGSSPSRGTGSCGSGTTAVHFWLVDSENIKT